MFEVEFLNGVNAGLTFAINFLDLEGSGVIRCWIRIALSGQKSG